MGTARRAEEKLPEFDHNKDRYPSFKEVLTRLAQEAELPQGPVERVEITTLASGEATYRIWTARAEEPEGGYLPAP